MWHFAGWVQAELDDVTLTESEQKDKDWRRILREKKRHKLERLLDPQQREPVTVASLAALGVPVVKSRHRTDDPEGDDGR